MHKLTRSHLAGGHWGRRAVVASLMAAGLLTGMMSVGGLSRANATTTARPLGQQLQAPKAHAGALNCGLNINPHSSSVINRQQVDMAGNGIYLWKGYDNDPAIGTEIWWVESGRNSYALEWTDNFGNPDAGPVQYCNDNLSTYWTPAVNEWYNAQGQHRKFRATDLAGHHTKWYG